MQAICNIDRVIKRMDDINSFSEQTQGKGITRLAYSIEERKALERIMIWCNELGILSRIDEVGNLIATWGSEQSSLPVVAIGSHIDSVINGGKYDGILGVIGALEVVQVLKENHVKPIYPIQIIVFACEESSRFNISMIGSKVLTGISTLEELKDIKDIYHKNLSSVLGGCDIQVQKNGKRKTERYKAFLELHVEQSSILEQLECDIGIVTDIAAPTRLKIEVEGVASHSGTTPLNMRKDAFVTSTKIIYEINQLIYKFRDSQELVATVSKIDIVPNVMNVVPGKATFCIDIRSAKWELKEGLCTEIKTTVQNIAKSDGLTYQWHVVSREKPVKFDQRINKQIERICEKLNYKGHYMFSLAGHDAMNMTRVAQSALIFIPSKDGMSHNPMEYSSTADMERGINVLIHTVLSLVNSEGDV